MPSLLRPLRDSIVRILGISALAQDIRAVQATCLELRDRLETRATLQDRLETLAHDQAEIRQLLAGILSQLGAAAPQAPWEAIQQSLNGVQDALAGMRDTAGHVVGLHRRIDDTHGWLEGVSHRLQELQRRNNELNRRLDDILMLAHPDGLFPPPGVTLDTAAPVAIYSNDHQHPRGVAADNTRHPRFVLASERILGPRLRVLDIGCAGGGLVVDFLKRGHTAIGLEGSDYALKQQAGSWPLIPHHLFTCDATSPFTLRDGQGEMRFDLVSAWEVLEHIPEDLLPGLLRNIASHLAAGGMFVGSVATYPDFDAETGVVWHVTLHDRDWWAARFQENGLEVVASPYVTLDYPRGSGNPALPVIDWNADANPEMGFHIAARRREV